MQKQEDSSPKAKEYDEDEEVNRLEPILEMDILSILFSAVKRQTLELKVWSFHGIY